MTETPLKRLGAAEPPSASDADPAASASNPTPTSLDDLYHQHWKELVSYIRRAFGDGPPDPEDAVQQAFAQYAALADPERVLNPRGFLYRCAANFVLGHKRRSKVRTRFALSAEAQFLFGGADEITAERVISARERAEILERAIKALKARHRDALIMNRIQGMTYAEIAKTLKVSETEARRLVTVALAQCDRALEAADKADDRPHTERGRPWSSPSNIPDDERIALEAADWVTRQEAGARASADQAEFEQWLDADPRHLQAYERVSQAWADIGGLTHIAPLQQPRRTGWRAFTGPRVAVTAFATLAAAIFVIVVVPNLSTRTAPQYETPIARIEPIHLEDGSLVTLGASSAIDANFEDATRREVTLRTGQAFFEIAHNAERPFFVLAGDVAVRVVGTKFDVRRGPEQTIISVREGIVRVSTEGQPTETLHAGDQVTIQHRTNFFVTRSVSTELAAVEPQSVASWRDGRLSYNDAPLSELIADINRYYAPGVDLASSQAGDVRITTSFRTDDIEGFLDDLSRAFPVEATRRPNGHYRINATERAS